MPTYTLKSNATMSAAKLVYVADNGLTNLVDSSALTVNGSMPTTTQFSRLVAGYGQDATNSIQAALTATVAANQKFAVLMVGACSVSIIDDRYFANGPSSNNYGTAIASGGQMVSTSNYWGSETFQALTGFSHPGSDLQTLIWGRGTNNKEHYFNGAGSSGGANDGATTVAAGNWKFGGNRMGVGLFAVFVGVSPSELATYISANGTGTGSALAYSALLNAAAAGPTINTQPTSASVTTPATATFTVAATASGGSLSYQWQRSTNAGGSWANVTTGTGGTTASYTTGATSVTGGTDNNGDQYRCAVTDSNGTTNTSSATLTVNAGASAKPSIRYFNQQRNCNV